MRNSNQRNQILKTVVESCDHPSAETIYLRVKESVPNISLGTVYRNLCLLTSQNMVRQIHSLYGPDRYDKTLKEHSHFFCHNCKEVCDIDFPVDIYKQLSDSCGHQIDSIEIMFGGICKNCRTKNAN